MIHLSRLVPVANEGSSLNFISLLSEIEGHIQSLQALSALNAIERPDYACQSNERLFQDTFLIIKLLSELISLSLIPEKRIKYLDVIFEQGKQVLGSEEWSRAVREGASLTLEGLTARTEALLTLYVVNPTDNPDTTSH